VLLNSHDKSSAYQLHCGLFRLVSSNCTVVADARFERISIKHSAFNPDSVIEASFKVLGAVPDIMDKVQLFQERILTDEQDQGYLITIVQLPPGANLARTEKVVKRAIDISMTTRGIER
jgi:Domain of unknown function (DUF932)